MKISANGIAIHYRLDGPESAPLVTLSHSLAAHLDMWAGQVAALPGYRVLRYDTRGHGGSDAPSGDYSLDLLVDDLFALLDALGIETTHYVGLSMGGMIGQLAAIRDPGRFRSLVLCNTTSRVPAGMRPQWAERIAAARRQRMEALVEPTIERWFSPAFREGRAAEVDEVRAMIRTTPVEGYCGCCAAIMGLDLTERLSAIERPVLLIAGERDPGTPVAAHETIRDRIAGAELVVLPGALHFSNVECRPGFNRALTDFLGRRRPPEAALA